MQSSSKSKSSSNASKNPLDDDDFSELTKNEIVYWSRKLKISPSEIFTMPKKELEERLERMQRKFVLDEEGRQKYYERWEHMTKLKDKLTETQLKHRLKGGAGRNIWDILAEAASQIEEMYGDSSFYDQSGHQTLESGTYDDDDTMASRTYETYNASPSSAFPTDMTYTISDEEPSLESTFEDSFQIDPNLASTPRGMVCGPRKLPVNDTYSIPATTIPNATFQARSRSPANATYTTRECPINSTYDARDFPANNTYNVRQCPMDASYKIAPYNFDESSVQWSPQSMAFTDQSYRRDTPSRCPRSQAADANSFVKSAGSCPSSTPNQTIDLPPPPSFRNYTDYVMKYSPEGTEESANSVSVENYDETSGIIRASSRSYTLPPSPDSPNITFDLPPLPAASRSTRGSSSPTRYPMPPSAAPAQFPTTTNVAPKTPARTPPNPRTYRPRKLADNF